MHVCTIKKKETIKTAWICNRLSNGPGQTHRRAFNWQPCGSSQTKENKGAPNAQPARALSFTHTHTWVSQRQNLFQLHSRTSHTHIDTRITIVRRGLETKQISHLATAMIIHLFPARLEKLEPREIRAAEPAYNMQRQAVRADTIHRGARANTFAESVSRPTDALHDANNTARRACIRMRLFLHPRAWLCVRAHVGNDARRAASPLLPSRRIPPSRE